MRMDEGLDTGDMIMTREVELAPDETGGSLFDRLAVVGAELCTETLAALEAGTATFTPQDHDKATKIGIIKKQFGEIDFTKSAEEIECLMRGLDPWPSAFTHVGGKLLKLWKADVTDMEGEPGTIIEAGKDSLIIGCGKGALSIKELQLEGKKRMQTADFLRGYSLNAGDKLG